MSNDNATLSACREALAAMEQAEAAMTQGYEWVGFAARGDMPALVRCHSHDDKGRRCIAYVATCNGCRCNNDADAAGIALLRNAAPGTLRLKRTLLDMCEAAMLSGAELVIHNSPGGAIHPVTVARHDFALAILAALADAMGVTGGGK